MERVAKSLASWRIVLVDSSPPRDAIDHFVRQLTDALGRGIVQLRYE